MTGLSAEEADEQWDLAFESLALGDNPNVPDVLWFSGAAYCDCHSEFVHGAHRAGGLAMNEMLLDLDDYNIYDEKGNLIKDMGDLERTEEYQVCFESCGFGK
jgi:hypothetical protein